MAANESIVRVRLASGIGSVQLLGSDDRDILFAPPILSNLSRWNHGGDSSRNRFRGD
jgi:hypothetical protein